VEDIDRTIEVLVFPEAYRICSRHLSEEDPVVIVGRLNKKDLNPKIVAENVVPLEHANEETLAKSPTSGGRAQEKRGLRQSLEDSVTAPEMPHDYVVDGIGIRVDIDAGEQNLLELKEVLSAFPGSGPVKLFFCRDNGGEVVAEIKCSFGVSMERNLLEKLRNLPYVHGLTTWQRSPA
jgi:hypothetical protein